MKIKAYARYTGEEYNFTAKRITTTTGGHGLFVSNRAMARKQLIDGDYLIFDHIPGYSLWQVVDGGIACYIL